MGKLLGLLKLGTKLGLAGGTVFVTHQVKFSRAPKTWALDAKRHLADKI